MFSQIVAASADGDGEDEPNDGMCANETSVWRMDAFANCISCAMEWI